MAPCGPAGTAQGTIVAPTVLLLGGASAGDPTGASHPHPITHPAAVPGIIGTYTPF